MVKSRQAFAIAMSSFVLLWTTAATSDSGTTIKALMTETEYQETGLQKLSDDELEKLYFWVIKQAIVSRIRCLEPEASKQYLQSDSEQSTKCHLATIPETKLNAAVAAHVAATFEKAKTEIRSEFEAAKTRTAFTSSVTNDFTGWDDKTVFVLSNGQVWRQRHGRPYQHIGTNSVRLEPSFFGMWRMTVLSSGRSVAVKRIE